MSDVDISEIVSSSISIEDNFPSREGFQTLLVLAYHTFSLARVLTYTRAGECAEDFPAGHHVRSAVDAAFSANPRPSIVKVGRRAGAPTQSIRLTPIDTTAARVFSGSIAGVEWTFTADASPTVAEICTGIAAAIDASSLGLDADAILTSLATSASPQTIDTEADGVIGLGEISPPRKITIVRSAHADHDAVTAVLSGLDEFGNAQSENVAFANGGGETLTSTKRYSRFTSLVIPAQAGTGGTTGIGIAAAVDATDDTTHVTVAATVAGTWFPFLLDNPRAEIEIEDRTAMPGTSIGADLDAVLAVDSDWYGLALADGNSNDQITTASTGAAAWALTNEKLLIVDTADSDVPDSVSTTDLAYELEATGNNQVAVLYHRGGGGYFPACRWFSRLLPTTPGTETWALKELEGLPTDDLTASERSAMKTKRCNFYPNGPLGGMVLGYLNGGQASGGRFLDLTRYAAHLNARIQEAVLQVVTAGDKLPFDDQGLSLIGSAIREQLEAGERQRSIRNAVLVIPLADDVPDADRADRLASGFEWDATYTGAVHKATISGRFAL